MIVHPAVADVGKAVTEAILLQVDGDLCVLGGGTWQALKDAMPADERAEMMDVLDDDVRALRPLPHGAARTYPLLAGLPWSHGIVAAAVLHGRGGLNPSAGQMEATLREAMGNAVRAAHAAGLRSLAMTLVGTRRANRSWNFPMSTAGAARAQALGLASAGALPVDVEWCVETEEERAIVADACLAAGVALA